MAFPVPNNQCYYTSNSFFWLAESVQWIFEISVRDVITADYTIIISRTLKVTGYQVMYDRTAWSLRVIMSSSRALCCLPSVQKQKQDLIFFRSMHNKTIRFGFCDIQIFIVSVSVISLSLRLCLITFISTLPDIQPLSLDYITIIPWARVGYEVIK